MNARPDATARMISQLAEALPCHGNSRPLFTDEGTRLFRASEAADIIGCHKGTPGRWARDGWIPKSRQGRFHVYTMRQVYMLARFHDIPKHDHDARSEFSKFIFENW